MWYVYFHRLANADVYVAVSDELTARRPERYFKSDPGKAFAKKRFWPPGD